MKSYIIRIAILFGIALLQCKQQNTESKIKLMQPINVILKHDITKPELALALNQINNTESEKNQLAMIANDSTYSSQNRRMCLFKLCRYLSKQKLTLGQLSTYLNHPLWLHNDAVKIFVWSVGRGNVFENDTEEGVHIYIEPRLPLKNLSAIHLKIAIKPEGVSKKVVKISEQMLYEIISGKTSNSDVTSLPIVKMVCIEKDD